MPKPRLQTTLIWERSTGTLHNLDDLPACPNGLATQYSLPPVLIGPQNRVERQLRLTSGETIGEVLLEVVVDGLHPRVLARISWAGGRYPRVVLEGTK